MENIEEMGSEHTELKPKLYLVPTPLGNLGDITLRAKAVLEYVSEVYCEDTRNSLKLMNALGIKKPLLSCHQHNEEQRYSTRYRAENPLPTSAMQACRAYPTRVQGLFAIS